MNREYCMQEYDSSQMTVGTLYYTVEVRNQPFTNQVELQPGFSIFDAGCLDFMKPARPRAPIRVMTTRQGILYLVAVYDINQEKVANFGCSATCSGGWCWSEAESVPALRFRGCGCCCR